MECKNCKNELEKDTQFCDNCGAKVIKSRITFKFLITELFINVFGVDSKFFLTLKKMITHPDDVLNEYISGVRKRYVNPFAFLAVGSAVSLLVFNFFSDDFIKINSAFNEKNSPELIALAKSDTTAYANLEGKELIDFKAKQFVAKKQLKFQEDYVSFMLNYYNLLAFLFLPLYALMSKLTYPKPHNFGEHIVMNAYLQGSSMYFIVICFLISLIINSPTAYLISTFLMMAYYLYAYSKFYKHSFGKCILKFLRFTLVVILSVVVIILVVGLITFILGYFAGKS